MIQANELRIFNYIYYENSVNKIVGIHSPTPHQSTRFDSKYLIEINLPDPFIVPIDEIAFIPITPEWLERAGFVKEFNSYKQLFFVDSINKKIIVCIGTKDCGHVDGFYYYDVVHEPKTKIEYVHTLQNLVKCLTGTELEFK